MDHCSETFTNNMLNAMLGVNNNNNGFSSFIKLGIYTRQCAKCLHVLSTLTLTTALSFKEFGAKPE